jgi:DNA-binding GntR family transcriptional regulator
MRGLKEINNSRDRCSLHVASHIRTRPGMRLPQAALAIDLGVSLIPLREALIVLEREGWISSEMFRGTYINTLDRATIHDHYELLGIVGGYTAQRAFARTNGKVVTSLIELLAHFTKTEDGDELQQISSDFHGAIARGAASSLLNGCF